MSQKLQQKNYQNDGVWCGELGHDKTEVGSRVVHDNTQKPSSMPNTEKLSDNVVHPKGNYSWKAMTSSTTRCDNRTCAVQTGRQKQDHLTQYENTQLAWTTGGDQLLAKTQSHTAHERQEEQNLNEKHAEKWKLGAEEWICEPKETSWKQGHPTSIKGRKQPSGSDSLSLSLLVDSRLGRRIVFCFSFVFGVCNPAVATKLREAWRLMDSWFRKS